MFPFLSILPNYYYKRKHTFFVYITTLKWKRGRKSLPTSIFKMVTTYLPQNLKNQLFKVTPFNVIIESNKINKKR